jgi:tRNA-binding EMAP/Myf-like protein
MKPPFSSTGDAVKMRGGISTGCVFSRSIPGLVKFKKANFILVKFSRKIAEKYGIHPAYEF